MDAITNRAYLAGLKLKQSGLSEEVIYARLEKQGFGEELSRRVAKDVVDEIQKETSKNNLSYGLVIAGIGLLGSIISAFVLPDRILLPLGLIVGGLLIALVEKVKLAKNK